MPIKWNLTDLILIFIFDIIVGRRFANPDTFPVLHYIDTPRWVRRLLFIVDLPFHLRDVSICAIIWQMAIWLKLLWYAISWILFQTGIFTAEEYSFSLTIAIGIHLFVVLGGIGVYLVICEIILKRRR